MKNILITGATGFIGKNLVCHLESKKYHVFKYAKNEKLNLLGVNAIVHLAGKAQDVKSTSNQQEYYDVNTELTIKIFDIFLQSDSEVFITLSSVKAVADELFGTLTEENIPNPTTHYGKSKLLAEQYILSKKIPKGKRVYILRPCLVHGLGNRGNLYSLYKLVSKGLPWPLGSFNNKRSYCSIDNLLFIIEELLERVDIQGGIYNVADDEQFSTTDLISLIAEVQKTKPKILKVSKILIESLARIGDFLHIPLNSEKLKKLTSSYEVNNAKIKIAIGKPLPVTSRGGLIKTFQSYKQND